MPKWLDFLSWTLASLVEPSFRWSWAIPRYEDHLNHIYRILQRMPGDPENDFLGENLMLNGDFQYWIVELGSDLGDLMCHCQCTAQIHDSADWPPVVGVKVGGLKVVVVVFAKTAFACCKFWKMSSLLIFAVQQTKIICNNSKEQAEREKERKKENGEGKPHHKEKWGNWGILWRSAALLATHIFVGNLIGEQEVGSQP